MLGAAPQIRRSARVVDEKRKERARERIERVEVKKKKAAAAALKAAAADAAGAAVADAATPAADVDEDEKVDDDDEAPAATPAEAKARANRRAAAAAAAQIDAAAGAAKSASDQAIAAAVRDEKSPIDQPAKSLFGLQPAKVPPPGGAKSAPTPPGPLKLVPAAVPSKPRKPDPHLAPGDVSKVYLSNSTYAYYGGDAVIAERNVKVDPEIVVFSGLRTRSLARPLASNRASL